MQGSDLRGTLTPGNEVNIGERQKSVFELLDAALSEAQSLDFSALANNKYAISLGFFELICVVCSQTTTIPSFSCPLVLPATRALGPVQSCPRRQKIQLFFQSGGLRSHPDHTRALSSSGRSRGWLRMSPGERGKKKKEDKEQKKKNLHSHIQMSFCRMSESEEESQHSAPEC